MYLNLPYPHWYKEYCVLNLPENVDVWSKKMGDVAEYLGAEFGAPGLQSVDLRALGFRV